MSYDAIIDALSQLKQYNHQPSFIYLLHPYDFKRIHVNKVSIYFMKLIKRNRKLRNNGFI